MTKLKEKQIRDKFLKFNMKVLKKRIKECVFDDLQYIRVGVENEYDTVEDFDDNTYATKINDVVTEFGKVCNAFDKCI